MSIAAPKTEPMTIPAIALRDNPRVCEVGAAADVLLAEGEVLDVADGNSGGMENI